MTNKGLNPSPDIIAQSDTYYQERLRQARIAFNFALAATVLSTTIVSLTGIILLVLGNVSSGVATAVGGATSGTISIGLGLRRLAREANDRLDQAARKN